MGLNTYHEQSYTVPMGYMSDYYAAKDAEDASGNVDWHQVPRRNGGYKDTGHPEDDKWWTNGNVDDSAPSGVKPKDGD